jgi:hypothetical protein
MEVTKANKTFTFFCPEVRSSISGGDQPRAKTLSFMQAERLIHQGCEPFLVTVQAGKAEDSKAPVKAIENLTLRFSSFWRSSKRCLMTYRQAYLLTEERLSQSILETVTLFSGEVTDIPPRTGSKSKTKSRNTLRKGGSNQVHHLMRRSPVCSEKGRQPKDVRGLSRP